MKSGSGTWKLDDQSLKTMEQVKRQPRYPSYLLKPISSFPGMTVRWAEDLDSSGKEGTRYVLRWETLGPNRDQLRSGPLPELTMLSLYKLCH
jgi:hypothetical protein